MGNPIDDHLRPFCKAIQDHMAKSPGPAWDATDDEAWRGIIRLLRPVAISGVEFSIHNGDGWTAPCWQVLFFIRNSQFRPTWANLESEIRKAFKMQSNEELTGHEAMARRIFSAPEKKALPPTPAETGQLDLPSWIDEFPSKDAGGPFDQVLLRPLMHLSDAEARNAIRVIREANEDWKKDREFARATKRDNMERVNRSNDILAKVCRALEKKHGT